MLPGRRREEAEGEHRPDLGVPDGVHRYATRGTARLDVADGPLTRGAGGGAATGRSSTGPSGSTTRSAPAATRRDRRRRPSSTAASALDLADRLCVLDALQDAEVGGVEQDLVTGEVFAV